jgi:hypothetical protein
MAEEAALMVEVLADVVGDDNCNGRCRQHQTTNNNQQ